MPSCRLSAALRQRHPRRPEGAGAPGGRSPGLDAAVGKQWWGGAPTVKAASVFMGIRREVLVANRGVQPAAHGPPAVQMALNAA